MRGWVYVMSNPAMPGYLKVGHTTDHYLMRAAQLHTTGVPAAFKVEYALKVTRCVELEKQAHRYLRAHRPSSNREFFTVSLAEAVQALERCLTDLGLAPLDTLDPKQQRSAARKLDKKRTDAELDRERKRRIETEAKTLIDLAKRPLNEAIKKTDLVLQICWAVFCGAMALIVHILLGHLPFWVWAAAVVAYAIGRVIPSIASIALVDHTPWGRGVTERQQAHIAAIMDRRDQAMKSPIVETMIAS